MPSVNFGRAVGANFMQSAAALPAELFAGLISGLTDALTSGGKLWVAQKGLAAVPAAIPTIEAALDARQRGFWNDKDSFTQILRWNGMGQVGDDKDRQKAWDAIYEARRPVANMGEITDAFVRGIIDQKEFCDLWSLTGAKWDNWDWIIPARQVNLGPVEIVLAWLRGLIKEEDADKLLRRHGILDENQRNTLKQMGWELPAPSDLLRFVARSAFNEDLAEHLRLDEELSDQGDFLDIARAQGIGKASYVNSKGQCKTVDYAKHFWRAHWDLPSPGQAYEMLQRLRPNRLARFKDILPAKYKGKLAAFTGEDLEALFRDSAQAPYFRPSLAAIAFRPLGRIDTRRLYDSKIIDKPELTEQMLDQGYLPEDAKRIADWAENERTFKYLRPALTSGKKDIIAGYRAGWLAKDRAALYLIVLTFRNLQEWQDFNALPPDAQAMKALADPIVAAWLGAADNALRTDAIKEAVAVIRGRLYEGMATLAESQSALSRLGLQPASVLYYISRWQTKMSGPRRTLMLRQLIGYYKEGAITIGNLLERAERLGYPREDLNILLSSHEIRVKKELAKFQAMMEKDAAKKAAAWAKWIKEVEREADKLRRQLAWKAPVTTLERWLKAGRITPKTFAIVAAVQGKKQPEIDLYIKEATEG